MKLKLIAAAALFAVAGQASASIANGASGNGELFLSVYDSVAQVSYARDLGITMNDFMAAGSTAGYSMNFAADTLLQSAFASLNGLKWNVVAADSTGGTAVGGQRYLSTTNATLATVKNAKNSNLTTGMSSVDNYINASNARGTQGGTSSSTAINGSNTAVAAEGFAYFQNGFANWISNTTFDSTALVGGSLGFVSMQASSTNGLSKISATQFGSVDGVATWTLASNGDLSYSVPAPVSAVPVPAALWLLGSGLIGMVGVARRKSA